jgi:hypothetical protein
MAEPTPRPSTLIVSAPLFAVDELSVLSAIRLDNRNPAACCRETSGKPPFLGLTSQDHWRIFPEKFRLSSLSAERDMLM